MKKIFVLMIAILSISSFTFAETIVLKSGKTVEGKIIEKTDKYIKIDIHGVPLTYYSDEIESINGEEMPLPLESSRKTFEDDKVIAVVLDKKFTYKELKPNAILIEQNRNKMNNTEYNDWLEQYLGDKLTGIITVALIEKYAKENNISATDAEAKEFISKLREFKLKDKRDTEKQIEQLSKELESTKLSEAEKERKRSNLKIFEDGLKINKELPEVPEDFAKQVVKFWKIGKAIYDRYGGCVISGPAGPEPIDSYPKYLKESEKNGSFQIMDKELEKRFWGEYSKNNVHTCYSKEEADRMMQTPWWLSEKQEEINPKVGSE